MRHALLVQSLGNAASSHDDCKPDRLPQCLQTEKIPALKKAPGCPLCKSDAAGFFYEDARRRYFCCCICSLIFVPEYLHISSSEEKAQYDLHRNEVEDPAYRGFLSRLSVPLVALLSPSAAGLEFGCGPGPALLAMFREAGYQMSAYDPFYLPDTSVLDHQYDFVSATEVVEHLRDPEATFEKLFSLVKPKGFLGLMTKMSNGAVEGFARWHYKNDPTHICFYQRSSFEWLADRYQANLIQCAGDVVIFQR